jgi:hypothetical protein
VSGSPRAGWGASIVAVLRRPSLWGVAVRQVLVLAAPGWWRRWPLLPLPAPGYLAFRMQTAYGDPAAAPRPEDVVSYLRWCRAWPAVARRTSHG